MTGPVEDEIVLELSGDLLREAQELVARALSRAPRAASVDAQADWYRLDHARRAVGSPGALMSGTMSRALTEFDGLTLDTAVRVALRDDGADDRTARMAHRIRDVVATARAS